MNKKIYILIAILFQLSFVIALNSQSITFEKEDRVMIKDGRRIYLDMTRQRHKYINCDTARNRIFHGTIKRGPSQKTVPFFPILNMVTFDSFYSDSEGRFSFTFPSGCPVAVSTITRNAAGVFIIEKNDEKVRDNDMLVIDGTYMIQIDEYLPTVALEKQLTKDHKWISWSDSSIQSCAEGQVPLNSSDFHAFSLHKPSQTYTSGFIERERFEVYQKRNENTIHFAYESVPGFKLRMFTMSAVKDKAFKGQKCAKIELSELGIFTQETILKYGLPKSLKAILP